VGTDITNLLPHQPRVGRALYVDMNSFFASVEQEVKPELRGQPVGVCPFVNDATCVIAVSTEAKRYGIKTGTLVRDARQLCPNIHLISDDPSIYRLYHRRIIEALQTTRCRVSVKSIDEAFLELPQDLQAQAPQVARQIRGHIHQVGSQLGCSIGIASNLFLAKMGTKLHKPNGIVEVHLEDLEAFYAMLSLTDLYGISWRMARQLEGIGITTPLAFYHAPYPLLKQHFGVNGERWYLRLRGYEVDNRPTTRRVVGHQTTIVPDPATTRTEVLGVASQLCYKAAVRLRVAALAAQSLQVRLRFTDRSYWTRTVRTHTPFWDSRTFFTHATTILEGWTPQKPVRLVSISGLDLMPHSALTTPLFDATTPSEQLSHAIDLIEARFGRRSIVPGNQLLGPRVTDRVGFGNAGQAAVEITQPG
jgi:DNA polymerase-4